MSAADGARWRDATVDDGDGLPHVRTPKRRAAAQEMTGVRSGMLTVVARQGRAISGGAAWLCRCDCGAEIVVPGSKLRGPNPQVSCRACRYAALRKPEGEKAPRVLRRRVGVRPSTISMRRYPKRELERLRLEYSEQYDRPRTRSECVGHVGPCGFVACKFHLYLGVDPHNGNIKLNFPDLEVWEMAETCALDVADRGGTTLEEVGVIANCTRERVRQVEDVALAKLKAVAPAELAEYLADEPAPQLVQLRFGRIRSPLAAVERGHGPSESSAPMARRGA